MSTTKPEISSPASYEKHVKLWNYNQVMKHGNRIDISGQGGWSQNFEKGCVFTYKSLEEEIEEAFKNVQVVLNSVGSSWKDVYSITSYHKKFDSTNEIAVGTMIRLLKEYIGERAPLWTSIGVETLAIPGMNVEIVVTAYTD